MRAGGSLHGKEVQSKKAARRSLGWDGVEIKRLLEIDCVSSWLQPVKDQVSSPEFWGWLAFPSPGGMCWEKISWGVFACSCRPTSRDGTGCLFLTRAPLNILTISGTFMGAPVKKDTLYYTELMQLQTNLQNCSLQP